MKTKLIALLVLAFFAITNITVTTTASAQTLVSAVPAQLDQPDAERVARAILSFEPNDYYEGDADGLYSNHWTHFNFVMDTALRITNLSVDGVSLPLIEPAAGIPLPTGGFQSFYVNLRLRDKYGSYKALGSFSTNNLHVGTMVQVTMHVNWVQRVEKIALPDGLTPQNALLILDNGSTATYDIYAKGFRVSIDPADSNIGWKLVDLAGNIYKTGTVGAFEAPTTSSSAPINVAFEGNVKEVSFDDSHQYFYDNYLPFDSMIFRSNSVVKGKVLAGYIGDAGFTLQTRSGVNVEVRQWTEEGAMPLVPLILDWDSYGYKTLHTVSNSLGRVIITLTDTNQPSAFASTYLWMARYTGVYGEGGTKGRPTDEP